MQSRYPNTARNRENGTESKKSDTEVGDDVPIDVDEIPDRWEINKIHQNAHESVQLDYYTEHGDIPSASILLQTPNTQRGVDMGYSVEVQDANADGTRHGLHPRAEWIPIWQPPQTDSEVACSPLDIAVRHVHRLAKEYPIEE